MLRFIVNRFGKNGQEAPPATENRPATLIDLRPLVKEFQTPAGAFRARKGVDLRVDRGEFVAVAAIGALPVSRRAPAYG